MLQITELVNSRVWPPGWGSGSPVPRPHSQLWASGTHTPAPRSATCASCMNGLRFSCTSHIEANYNAQGHTRHASTRPRQGHLQVRPWLSPSIQCTSRYGSDPVPPCTGPTSALPPHPLPLSPGSTHHPSDFLSVSLWINRSTDGVDGRPTDISSTDILECISGTFYCLLF